jgi:hypothetical protein
VLRVLAKHAGEHREAGSNPARVAAGDRVPGQPGAPSQVVLPLPVKRGPAPASQIEQLTFGS